MSEKQAAYNAGPAHPTSVERLCDALELDYAPAVYSTPALFDKAVDKITALQYALEEAQRIAALRLTDCVTMATEAEKYKAERDEARAIARKLWREKIANFLARCEMNPYDEYDYPKLLAQAHAESANLLSLAVRI